MFRDASPTFGPSHFASGNAPPSPPFSAHNDPLDDIYGSAPSSPNLAPHSPTLRISERPQTDEILSDLPSRQRTLDTDAYREGLSNSKGQYVQEGFDEGFSLGANIGQSVGYILGVLQGLVTAWRGHDRSKFEVATDLWNAAQKELAIEELLGQQWINEEGIWKWEVHGEEEDGKVTFQEVAAQHPTLKRWLDKVTTVADEWRVDLQAIEKNLEPEERETS